MLYTPDWPQTSRCRWCGGLRRPWHLCEVAGPLRRDAPAYPGAPRPGPPNQPRLL